MNNHSKSYEVFDGCYGEITGRCNAGAFLSLDNGQEAFAYKFANLLPGTRVICTILRQATENRKMLVSIDSVTKYVPLVA